MSTASHPAPHVVPVSAYLTVYAALMALLVVTVGAAYINVEPFNFTVTMVVAVTKAVLVILIFMHVRYSEKLVWVFSAASFLWLLLLLLLCLGDYLTRGMLDIPGK